METVNRDSEVTLELKDHWKPFYNRWSEWDFNITVVQIYCCVSIDSLSKIHFFELQFWSYAVKVKLGNTTLCFRTVYTTGQLCIRYAKKRKWLTHWVWRWEEVEFLASHHQTLSGFQVHWRLQFSCKELKRWRAMAAALFSYQLFPEPDTSVRSWALSNSSRRGPCRIWLITPSSMSTRTACGFTYARVRPAHSFFWHVFWRPERCCL